jgi:hypothetical protein
MCVVDVVGVREEMREERRGDEWRLCFVSTKQTYTYIYTSVPLQLLLKMMH